MSDEQFVDFYQILELPLDADRDTLRKRINAVYLDAQGNLDHRNFATRLRFQELFESTLPQARFVLLDDARRAEYLILVRAFRAPPEEVAAYLPPLSRGAADPNTGANAQSDAPLSREAQRRFDQQREREAQFSPEDEFAARGAGIEPLPTARPDAEQLEAQRQELWKKWKAGLEEALQQQGAVNPNNSLTRAAPSSEASTASSSRETPARQREFKRLQEQEEAAKREAQRESQREAQRQAQIAAEAEAADALTASGIEARRVQHRRDVTREILVDVGLFWSCVGALLVAVPGAAGLIGFMGHNFPGGGRALLPFNPNLLWGSGLLLVAALSFASAYALARAMRRRKATQLAALSYEELLRKSGGAKR